MNLFEKAKDNVSVMDAAARCGLIAKRNGMTRCSFYNDCTPSLMLNIDCFFFECGAMGDVIDLTARLFDLSLAEAVSKLAGDLGINDTGQTTKTAKALAGAQQFRNKEWLCFSVLVDYLRLLQEWKDKYAPATLKDALADHFMETCYRKAYIEHLTDIFIPGSREELARRWMSCLLTAISAT